MSSEREPLPKAVVIRANKAAQAHVPAQHPPEPQGDAALSTETVKKKPKKPRTGRNVHVEDAASRALAGCCGQHGQNSVVSVNTFRLNLRESVTTASFRPMCSH
jgi:hypothetical protein